MADRVSDLFSPERLRKSWISNGKERPASEPLPDLGEKPDFFRTVERIGVLLTNRYKAEQEQVLRNLLAEMEGLLHQRFPEAGAEPLSEEDRAALNFEIEERITDMEDLVEALDRQKAAELEAGGRR